MFVDRIYKADPNSPWSETKLEKLTVQGETDVKHFVGENEVKKGNICFKTPDPAKNNKNNDPARLKIAKRTAQEVKNGMHINLGIGIPTRILAVLPKDVEINLHSENGIMGIGPFPTLDKVSGSRINASKVTLALYRKPSLSKKEAPTSLLQIPLALSEEGIST